MKAFLTLFLALPLGSAARLPVAAPELKYLVADIPPKLREGAHAVLRADDEIVGALSGNGK